MVAVITSISPAGHGIFKPISTTSHDPVQNSRLRGLRGMAKPLKKSAPQGSHPVKLLAAFLRFGLAAVHGRRFQKAG
jgi:hypothetical protein